MELIEQHEWPMYPVPKNKNDYNALVLALKLAMTAPDEASAKKCVDIAESIAGCLSEVDVERAKSKALNQLKEL